jgi:hypothetical protein
MDIGLVIYQKCLKMAAQMPDASLGYLQLWLKTEDIIALSRILIQNNHSITQSL